MTKSLFDNPPLTPAPATKAPDIVDVLKGGGYEIAFDIPAAAAPQAAPLPPAPPVPVSPSLVPLTEDDVKRALPTHLRASVTPNLVQTLNQISADPLIAENIRDNFISYTAVLKEGKFKTEDYLSAVTYVSFKLMGHNNEDAYAKTFPARYSLLLAKGASKKDISAYVSAFARGKLVNLVMEQSLVPTWVLNQDIHQKAINQLATLMMNANSEKVQAEAAIGLLTHLKKPETKTGFQINLNQAENSGMKDMREMLEKLADQQQSLIQGGQMKTIDVAGARLVNKEDVTDVE
jgi:hypothetical protein